MTDNEVEDLSKLVLPRPAWTIATTCKELQAASSEQPWFQGTLVLLSVRGIRELRLFEEKHKNPDDKPMIKQGMDEDVGSD